MTSAHDAVEDSWRTGSVFQSYRACEQNFNVQQQANHTSPTNRHVHKPTSRCRRSLQLRVRSLLRLCVVGNIHKKFGYSRGTARRALSVETLSTAAQLHEKSHFKGLQQVRELEGHSRSLEMTRFTIHVRGFTTFTMYVTVRDLEKSFSFNITIEITSHVRFLIHIYIQQLTRAMFTRE